MDLQKSLPEEVRLTKHTGLGSKRVWMNALTTMSCRVARTWSHMAHRFDLEAPSPRRLLTESLLTVFAKWSLQLYVTETKGPETLNILVLELKL